MSASALPTTTALRANAPFAPTSAAMPVSASLRSSWLPRRAEFTRLHGTQRNTLGVSATWADAAPTVRSSSAPLALMCSKDTATRPVATALGVASATTLQASATASTATMAPSASSRPSSGKLFCLLGKRCARESEETI